MDDVRLMQRSVAQCGGAGKSRGRRVRVFLEIDAQNVVLTRDDAVADVAHDAPTGAAGLGRFRRFATYVS